MRIAVLSDLALGSHRASAINVIKTAGGFARLGHQVTIYCRAPDHPTHPTRSTHPTHAHDDARAAYAEPTLNFRCCDLPDQADERLADERFLQRFAEWGAAEIARHGAGLVYARHTLGALACLDRGMATIAETHLPIENDWAGGTRCLREAGPGGRLLGLITIGAVLRDRYLALGASIDRVRIVPDAVDVDLFTPPPPSALPPAPYPPLGTGRAVRVVYAGHLYDYKGIPTLLDAAADAPDLEFHLLGGNDADIARVRQRAAKLANVVVHGRVPHAQVPAWLWHADVLVLPPSARHESAAWTSPVKLGEYVASGRPIVATRIPALRAWVGEPIVRWCEPDNPRSVLDAVRAALAMRDTRDDAARANEARQWADRFSYIERARAILRHADLGRTRHLTRAA